MEALAEDIYSNNGKFGLRGMRTRGLSKYFLIFLKTARCFDHQTNMSLTLNFSKGLKE